MFINISNRQINTSNFPCRTNCADITKRTICFYKAKRLNIFYKFIIGAIIEDTIVCTSAVKLNKVFNISDRIRTIFNKSFRADTTFFFIGGKNYMRPQTITNYLNNCPNTSSIICAKTIRTPHNSLFTIIVNIFGRLRKYCITMSYQRYWNITNRINIFFSSYNLFIFTAKVIIHSI